MSSERFEDYLTKIAQTRLLTADEERELGLAVQKGEEPAATAARDKLVEHNLRLVVNVARSYQKASHLSLEELAFEGNLGLIKAAERFNPNLFDNRFSTYATWWIQMAVKKALNTALPIRTPVRRVLQLSRVVRCESFVNGQEEQDVKKIAAETKFTEADVRACLAGNIQVLSLDVPVMDDSEETLESVLPSPASDPFEHAMLADDLRFLKDMVGSLSEMEQDVVNGRFGISCAAETLESMAVRHQLSTERIRQIQKEALDKLRRQARRQLVPA